VGTDFAAALGGLVQLESISIGGTTLRDLAGLAGALKNRDSFKSLTINNCGVEDISALAQLKHLTSLTLMRNQIKDVSSLAGMTKLSTLILSQNKVADLSPMAEVPNLGTLWLSGNQFKDISPLMELKKLRMVTIHSTLVPTSQLEELRKAIPGCRVDNKAASS
jgi:Leucine-rich repeat (LRR) protein